MISVFELLAADPNVSPAFRNLLPQTVEDSEAKGMSEFRVTVTEQKVYTVQAIDHRAAAARAIALAQSRVRPDYEVEPTADAEAVEERKTA